MHLRAEKRTFPAGSHWGSGRYNWYLAPNWDCPLIRAKHV